MILREAEGEAPSAIYQPSGHFIFGKKRYLSGCQLPVTDCLPLIASDLVWYLIGCAYRSGQIYR